MGNENATPERHVSFGDANNDGYGSPRSSFRESKSLERPFDDRDSSYHVQGPQMRSRESTFSLGQRIQGRAQDIDDVEQRWQQPRPAQRPPLRIFRPPRVTEEPWDEAGYDEAAGAEQSFHSTRRQVRVTPNNRFTTTTAYSPMTSRVTRVYRSTDYPEERSSSRAFNTRDPNDLWYNYRPPVNKRADWALVGRHVLRPGSAAVMTSGGRNQVFYDDDSASSDPTSNRLRRGMGPGMVRRTDYPRVPRGTRTVYLEEENDGGAYGRWPGQTNFRFQRPTNNFYQNYRR